MARMPAPTMPSIEAVLQTETGGRAFLLESDDNKRVVVTAAHCLPEIPPAHPGRYANECTFQDFLGPLDGKVDIWVQCQFADIMADIAVLGPPEHDDLYDQYQAFESFAESRPAFRRSARQFAPREKHPGFVLSLENVWVPCILQHGGRGVWIDDHKMIKSGMSGSPIVDADGAAVGVVSTGMLNPRLSADLPGWLLDKTA
jgi:hypothetical protein